MTFRKYLLIGAVALCTLFPPAYAEEPGGSGLALPRFASLAKDEAHIRTGPSQEYPIKWTYQRKGLPVEIVQEYDSWRKIRDQEGATGWVHKILLSGKRTIMVAGKNTLDVYEEPDQKKVVARADPGVVGTIEECQPIFCMVRFSSLKGWVEKKNLWGVYPSEILN